MFVNEYETRNAICNLKVKLFYSSRTNYRSHLSVPALILVLGPAPTQLLPQTMIHFLLADSRQEYQKSLECILGVDFDKHMLGLFTARRFGISRII